jgi:putative nucleotidyltransferase with HDIG domain
MDYNEASDLMKSKLKSDNLRKHCFAVAAVMKKMAGLFDGDPKKWEVVGLVHDLDLEVIGDDFSKHALVTAKWLEELGVDEDIILAVKAHNDKSPRDSMMEKAIYCADPITGFLVACALIHPDKKLAPIDVPFAMKRMKEKRFAAGADRDRIKVCEELGLSLEKFVDISLTAMKEEHELLGL